MLNRVFRLELHGTTVRTELIAGLTTFLTMAYIVVVNPVILGAAGMPMAGVAAATCFAAAFGSIFMGLMSNYPLALAPGMGLNAYFTYTVVKGMGVPWQTALGCVFLSGIAFFFLTIFGVRQLILNAGAARARLFAAALAGGVGLFIAFIGLSDAGVIVARRRAPWWVSVTSHDTDDRVGGARAAVDRGTTGLAGQWRNSARYPRDRWIGVGDGNCPLRGGASTSCTIYRQLPSNSTFRRL